MRLFLLIVCLFVIVPYAAHAEDCPRDPGAAIAAAKAALSSPDTSKDRAALLCLTQAVAALDAKLSDVLAGKVPFTGAVWSPQGMTVTKPADQAGDE